MTFYNEPVQTAIISCRGHSDVLGKKMHKDNLITVDWHMPASFRPAMYAISIGKSRFSYGLIRSSRCFCVNFIGGEYKEIALTCGRESGMQVDKFHETGMIKEECDKLDCPRLGQARAYLECEVVSEVDAGDHMIFIGKILSSKKKEDGSRLFHTTEDKFQSIG